MPIYKVSMSLVDAHRAGAHIWPPDGKKLTDEDAEMLWFTPDLHGARGLDAAEIALLRRCRVELMQKPAKPLNCAGYQHSLMIVRQELADLLDRMAPGKHQMIPLSNVWHERAKEPIQEGYLAVLIMDYALSLDLDRSEIVRSYLPHLDKTAVALTGTCPEQRVVRKETAASRSLWADAATGTLLCTEAARKQIEALPGLSGLRYDLCAEV